MAQRARAKKTAKSRGVVKSRGTVAVLPKRKAKRRGRGDNSGDHSVPDEVYERHLAKIDSTAKAMERAKAEYDQAKGVHQSAFKAAKGDGCDIDIWLGVGTFSTWEDTTTAGASTGATTSASADTATTTEDTTTRCKLQRFAQTFTQAGLWDALRYEGMFRVCYVPTRRIVSISDVHGDMVWTAFYLSWFGNDAGYPYAVILGHKVEVYYRGTASFCIVPRYGCGPSKHPWVKISFWDNNTLQRTSGVT